MKAYAATISEESYEKAKVYLSVLKSGVLRPGKFLSKKLEDHEISELSVDEFLEILMNTKRPQIFAESDVIGNGEDWSQVELSLLGDVGVVVPVTVFDDAGHIVPVVHERSFSATLLFTAGALLRNGQGVIPTDWEEVHKGGEFSLMGYFELYQRRILPLLKWINADCQARDTQALVTVPGLGCGQFAGVYQGQLGAHLEEVLKQIIRAHAKAMPNIRAIWFDPYSECEARDENIAHIKFLTRPLLTDLFPRPQLNETQFFGFENCGLYSFVAWDHVSWPGNDFYVGSRATDDGVKAAATDTMRAMTGVEGQYYSSVNKYLPPGNHPDWIDVVYESSISLEIQNSLFIA